MGQIEGRDSAVRYLEKVLEEFDLIILIGKLDDVQLRDAFYDGKNFRDTDKKILILSEREDAAAGKTEWRRVSVNVAEEILKLYYLYEFSNRIVVVEHGQIFGSLLNYIAAGLLTGKEMVEAFLR